MLNIRRHPRAFARLTAIQSADQDSSDASLFGPRIPSHFTDAAGSPSSSLTEESRPRADPVQQKQRQEAGLELSFATELDENLADGKMSWTIV